MRTEKDQPKAVWLLHDLSSEAEEAADAYRNEMQDLLDELQKKHGYLARNKCMGDLIVLETLKATGGECD